jgi:hypothetical protein
VYPPWPHIAVYERPRSKYMCFASATRPRNGRNARPCAPWEKRKPFYAVVQKESKKAAGGKLIWG